MASTERLIPSILPPTKKDLVVKDRFHLVLELLWLFFVILPTQILLIIYKKVFPPSGKSFKDQVVIVTGAGRGLGSGLALRFGKEGAKVAVVDIDSFSAAKTAKSIVNDGGIAKSYFTNIGSKKDIKQLRESVTKDLGPVDIIVNNAGIIYGDAIESMPEDAVRSVIEINLLSHIWMAQEFLPVMKSRNSGHIVAISSLSALVAIGNGSAYSASKSGVMGFMDSMRTELNFNPINNIKTTTILPYFINTSEDYVNQWDLRLPPLSVEKVVEAIITAIKKDEVILSIPKSMFYSSNILRLLPTEFRDKIYSIIYFRFTTPVKRNTEDRSQHLINEVTKRRQE